MRVHVTALIVVVATAMTLALSHSSPATAREGEKASTEAVEISTPRGVKLVGVVHKPAQPNGVAVVIGSGRGYHKDLPLLRNTADALQRAGFTAIRFDWAYFTAKGKHAPDLSTEMLDLEAVIAYARKLPGIKALYLAGKSLGSVAVTMRVLKKADDLDGLILLTLPIHGPKTPDEFFEDMNKLQQVDKRMMIVCGDADPYSRIDRLYAFASGFKQAPRLVIVPGDHGMHGPAKNEARTLENCDLAARGVALWASRWQQADAE